MSKSGYIHERHFTLEEARSHRVRIAARIERLAELKRRCDTMNYNIYKHEYFGGLGPNGSKFHPAELIELVSILRDVETHGVVVKSLDEGLIDFPSLRENGEEVYLCWKIGEADIEYWHAIPDGFAGRKPISEF